MIEIQYLRDDRSYLEIMILFIIKNQILYRCKNLKKKEKDKIKVINRNIFMFI